MNNYLTTSFNYLNNLSLREKLLILAVLFAAIYSVWDIFFFSHHNKQQQQIQNELQKNTQLQQDLATEIAKIQAKLIQNVDPNKKLKQTIQDTKNELVVKHQELETELDKLVPPTKITELLRSVLLQSQGLELISLNNETVQPIVIQQDKTKNSQNNEPQTKLYDHATTIKLSGNYLQLHLYLTALESSPWGLFWDQLEYVVKDYPTAEISLRVHTVSTDEHWIGL